MKSIRFAVWLTLVAVVVLPSACGGSSTEPVRCTYGDALYHEGDDFPSNDGCNTCSCMGDGSIACTEKACLSCDDITAQYSALLDQAKTCDPEQPNQCTSLVVEGLRCGCQSFVNPQRFDAGASAALQLAYDAAACGEGIVCGPCAVPMSSHCSSEGECVDDHAP